MKWSMNSRHFPLSQLTPVNFSPCAVSSITINNPKPDSFCLHGRCAPFSTVSIAYWCQVQASAKVAYKFCSVLLQSYLFLGCSVENSTAVMLSQYWSNRVMHDESLWSNLLLVWLCLIFASWASKINVCYWICNVFLWYAEYYLFSDST